MDDEPGGVAAYKRVLRAVCDNRPSGTRQRMATALGTNRSFVSQLVNPSYAMPIPAQHLEAIFEVCHFSAAERAGFLLAYDAAHPGRREVMAPPPRTRAIVVTVPDTGEARRNEMIDEMVAGYASGLGRLLGLPE